MRTSSVEREHPPMLRVGLICAAVAVFVRCAWFWSVKDAAFLYAHVQDAALYHELAVSMMSDGLPLTNSSSTTRHADATRRRYGSLCRSCRRRSLWQ